MILTPRRAVSFLILLVAFLCVDIRRVSAFASPFNPTFMIQSHAKTAPLSVITNSGNKVPSIHTSSTSTALKSSMEARGGAQEAAAVPKPVKKMRITAFDSMRFVLCVMIVCGHFISFANPSPFVLKFFSQHNTVPVSAFFLLSGYVAAYTSTENGQRLPSDKLIKTPKPQWILSKVFGYYPLHLLVLLLFSPLFIYTDLTYNGPWTAAKNAFMSSTLIQAWFPLSAEVWNAPTWFLSALSFSLCALPYGLRILAG